jgi:drug/metabolite transporter (DMT)-like permease
LLIGVIGGSVPFYLYFTGLSSIPAINSAIIHKTLVFWVVLLAIPFLKEKISANTIFAVLILFLSNFLIGGFKGFQFSKGEFFILIATIFWAVENVLAKKILSDVSPTIMTAFRMVVGSIILISVTFIFTPSSVNNGISLSYTQWFWLILTVTTLMGYVIVWYRALKLESAVTVTSILVSSTIVTNTLSAIFLTHTWSFPLSLQTVFICIGVIMVVFKKNTLKFLLSKKLNPSLPF